MKPGTLHPRLGALLALAVTLTYANHFGNAFHFDDSHTIQNNAYIRSLSNLPRFFVDGTTFSSLPSNQSYRPVVSATLALDYALAGGLKPFWFHLSTFLLFLVQGWLMMGLYRLVLPPDRDGAKSGAAALVAVAWYLLHPANAETVNYVIARSDTLSTLGVVAALVLYGRVPWARRWPVYLVPAALAVLAKPLAVVFAPLLFVQEWLFGEAKPDDRRHPAVRAAQAALPSLVASVLLLVLVKAMDPKTWVPGGTSRFAYAITQPFVLLHYFVSFFVPYHLSADSDWKALSSVLDWRFAVGCGFLALLAAALVLTWRRRPWRPVAFGLAWFAIGTFPTSFVFPLAEVVNDHRVFLPYVGLSLAAVWTGVRVLEGCARAARRPELVWRGAAVFTLLALTAYAVGTVERNRVWRTEESLWRDVTQKSPANGRGWMNYGLALMARGDYEGAERCYRQALQLVPNYSFLHTNLGIVLAATGRKAEAEVSFLRSLALAPGNTSLYFFYARFLHREGRNDEAAALLREALRRTPADANARELLLTLSRGDPRPLEADRLLAQSVAAYRGGRPRECLAAARRVLELRPHDDAAYNNVCAAHNALGEWDAAIAACSRALDLNPSNSFARNNLAWARRRGGPGP